MVLVPRPSGFAEICIYGPGPKWTSAQICIYGSGPKWSSAQIFIYGPGPKWTCTKNLHLSGLVLKFAFMVLVPSGLVLKICI